MEPESVGTKARESKQRAWYVPDVLLPGDTWEGGVGGGSELWAGKGIGRGGCQHTIHWTPEK